jgi:signal transduction histidine kinase
MSETPTREPADPTSPTTSEAPDASSWFLRAWDLLFVVLVAGGTIRAFTLDRPVAHAWIVTSLAAATTAWYVAPLLLHRPGDRGDRTASWLGGVVAGSVTLSVLAPDFAWLAFPIAFQLGYRLSTGSAAAAGIALAAAAMAGLARDNGQLRLAEVIGPSLGITMAVIVAIGYRTVLDQRDHNRRLLEQLAATQQRLREVERERGVAEERARLSREIHDTLAQALASSLLHVQAVARALDRDSEAHERLGDIERQLRDGLEEARRFVRDLAPADLDDTPLTESLRRLCQHDGRVDGPTVTFDVSGHPHPLLTDHEVTLCRSAQEALRTCFRWGYAACLGCQGRRPGVGAIRRVMMPIMAHLTIASAVAGRRS